MFHPRSGTDTRDSERQPDAEFWEWMSLRICLLLDGSAGAAALDREIKAEEEERKRAREQRKAKQRRVGWGVIDNAGRKFPESAGAGKQSYCGANRVEALIHALRQYRFLVRPSGGPTSLQESPMQNLRNQLIAGGAVLLLAAIGTMMNRQAMQAAGGPSVTIESPIPLPVTGTVAVTGSTTVSGTVAATQSGTWNVGVTGTPNVHVTNPATAPAFFLSVNDTGRIAYQSLNTNPSCSGGQCLVFFPAVPSQHRLVVQHFSGLANFSAAPSFVNAS